MMTPMHKTFNWESPPRIAADEGVFPLWKSGSDCQAESSERESPVGNPARNETDPQRTRRVWKVVITEIQDASTLDPIHAPPGAFFVSIERFARTVDYLDLSTIINVINRMQCSSREHVHEERAILSEKIPRLGTKRLTGVEPFA
jgi:hypothetical protein